METRNELLTPALVALGDKLIPCGSELFRIWRFRRASRGEAMISVLEPIKTLSSGFHWMVDANGIFIEFIEIERSPKTPNFLKRVVNFTRIYYRLGEPRAITLQTLHDLSKGKHGGMRKYIGAAINRYGAEASVTKEIFLCDIMREQGTADVEAFVLQ